MSKKKREIEEEEREDAIPTVRHVPTSGIDAIKVSGSGLLTITQNATQAEEFVIASSQGNMPDLDITIDGNTLVVTLKDKASFFSRESIAYRMNVGTLSKIDVADKVAVEIANINVPTLVVRASGSSSVSGLVSANVLTVDSSDSCDVTLSGCVDEQTVRISGNCEFDGRNLDGKSITIDGSGTASVYCNVSDVVAGSLLGSGSLVYTGSPVVDIDSSKDASVKKVS